jgi:hypothetical protein
LMDDVRFVLSNICDSGFQRTRELADNYIQSV